MKKDKKPEVDYTNMLHYEPIKLTPIEQTLNYIHMMKDNIKSGEIKFDGDMISLNIIFKEETDK